MTRTRLALLGLVAGAFAAVALGQNADKNSAGPTKNDYRLRVIEPAEGVTIAGSTVRVVVNTEIPAEAGDTRRDVNSMPRPDVDVFLDGSLKGTMQAAQNVLEIENVSPGPHKVVLLAKNRANEIIDRKQIAFSSTAAETSASSTMTPPEPAAAPPEHEIAPALAPIEAEPAPAPAPPPAYRSSASMTPPQVSPPASRESRTERTLPETATLDPALALAGVGLIAAGLVARRRLIG